MPYGNNILTSIYGRRLGLIPLSTGQSGAAVPIEVLAGPDDFRLGITTNETTAAAMNPAGISLLTGTSAASTPVFTLAPPIPGVKKIVIMGSTDSAIYVKCATGVAIAGTSLGTTGACAIRSSGGGLMELQGVTTALHYANGISSTAVNGLGFQATT